MIDKTYLEAVGWKGIRIRGEHLQARLRNAIQRQLEKRGRVRIVDVAAGTGRYLLNVLDRYRGDDLSVRLCDLDRTALERGRSRAAYLGLTNLDWTESDAFDPEQVRSVSSGADIAIVSGLYELFPDNELVRRSLCALHDGLAPGGLLLYTGQPWHPQLEFIARTLTHQDGSPWRMRRRTQAELDWLVRSAGFEKQDMDIDHYGIFTVSVALKEG
jgi:SAM-dependent methyltransferase